MPKMKIYFRSKVLPSAQETADMVAKDFIRFTDEMFRFREKLYIAVSGGSTPDLFFDLLATEYPNAVKWQKLHFFWVDERCVPHNHVESNYGNAYRRCFAKVGIPIENLHPVMGGDNPVSETVRYTGDILSHVPCDKGYPTFDLILLGMGEDGHTASIFPGQEQLFKANSIVSISENPISGQKRITLTGKVLNNASEVVFVVTGHKKKEVLEQILLKKPEAKFYPSFYVIPEKGRVSWYLDREAAGGRKEFNF
jgi:6-phosphogluconolactonase